MLTKERKSNIGLYRQRVRFEEFTTTTTPSGGTTQSWQLLDTRWANIKPLSGRERRQIEGLQSEVSHEIEIRHSLSINGNQIRAVYKGRIFKLHYSINKGEENTYTEFSATELLGDLL